jgi:gamma-glutamyltranspeptidase/glutathione hydrolase/leukotriene-C4 hydrolase
MNKLWFGLSLDKSIDRPRLHHQLFPNKIYYERNSPYRVSKPVRDGLKALSHELGWSNSGCAIQGVYRNESGQLYGKSDPRKSGVAVVLQQS